MGGVDPVRDESERALLAAALAVDLPVLAVCRGCQILNVELGGTLYQHLPDVVGHEDHRRAPSVFGEMEVTTTPGSRTAEVFGAETTVLCSHHQSIDALGTGLVVTARAPDGVIEAVELPGRVLRAGGAVASRGERRSTTFRRPGVGRPALSRAADCRRRPRGNRSSVFSPCQRADHERSSSRSRPLSGSWERWPASGGSPSSLAERPSQKATSRPGRSAPPVTAHWREALGQLRQDLADGSGDHDVGQPRPGRWARR